MSMDWVVVQFVYINSLVDTKKNKKKWTINDRIKVITLKNN